MFKILDYCYNITFDYDLGGLLGELSCDLFLDGQPVDPASYADWLKISSSSNDLMESIISFLEMYEKNYGFNFFKTKSCLKTLDIQTLNLK